MMMMMMMILRITADVCHVIKIWKKHMK
jgi:hypothetical protein